MRQLVAALAMLLSVAAAHAQSDHLACFKIRDTQPRVTYTADIAGLVLEPGCVVRVPAAMACVPATKSNVTPAPPGSGGTGTPNSFFCYKMKCPKTALPPVAGSDQFGSRTVTPTVAKLVCAPLAGPTTTTTTSTTTTTLRFVDNGDGTVTDHQTGLQWEKKVAGSGCLHCVNDAYTWSSTGTAPDGTAFTGFLNTLNGGATGVGNCITNTGSAPMGGFANRCDWRLPTIVELQTIVNCSFIPCFNPIFGPPGIHTIYWSSTSDGGIDAWGLRFSDGMLFNGLTSDLFVVRAVRGGS
jgi:hypothetical protein